MKISELRGKSADQLKEQLLNLKKELFNLRFQKATGELEKTSRIRDARRTIAKIQTIIAEVAKKGVAKNA